MKGFSTKWEKKLYGAVVALSGNCVDRVGLPKTPTVKQIKKAIEVINEYDKYSETIPDDKLV